MQICGRNFTSIARVKFTDLPQRERELLHIIIIKISKYIFLIKEQKRGKERRERFQRYQSSKIYRTLSEEDRKLSQI